MRSIYSGFLKNLRLSAGLSLNIRCYAQIPRFTPQQVTEILRANEFTSGDFQEGIGPVRSFDINNVGSNKPVEDAHAEAFIKSGPGTSMLFGVIDGHGGAACGQVVSRRLLHYAAAGLVSIQDLAEHVRAIDQDDKNSPFYNLLETFDNRYELVKDLKMLYRESYRNYAHSLLAEKVNRMDYDEYDGVDECLIRAFQSLDEDMSNETGSLDLKTLTVAMSGAVALLAHVDGPHLRVASTGDCSAVLGSLSENDTWVAKKMTVDHNSDNADEVKRILSEHPSSEAKNIICKDRLLGILAPLRAFGDFKFKWPADKIVSVLGPLLGEYALPKNYKTPPYLSVTPEVTSHKLTARDKFLVLATDGLWDTMTPMQVIRLVGEHMSGKITLNPLELSRESVTLNDVNAVLRHRQAAMRLKPDDVNSATHIIRNALGGTAYGVDHGRLSQMLSIPQDMVRMFRDDITVQIVFFDSEFLRHV